MPDPKLVVPVEAIAEWAELNLDDTEYIRDLIRNHARPAVSVDGLLAEVERWLEGSLALCNSLCIRYEDKFINHNSDCLITRIRAALEGEVPE